MEQQESQARFGIWYNKNYKKLLFITAIAFMFSIYIIANTYISTGDFFYKDVSLTGGTSVSLFTQFSASELQSKLSSQFPDVSVRSLLDNSGKQTQLIITTTASPEKITPAIESILNISLTEQNSSIEFTGSSISQGFYKQLLIAVLLAFFWMAAIVFIIFSSKLKIKILAILLNLFLGIFLGKFLLNLPIIISLIILFAFISFLVFIYIKHSIPSFAVMFCAFADILMTLAFVNFLQIKVSTAGIIAFLMLIGYSVDTDILLTTRVMKRKTSSVNSEMWGAFKTGMTMTLTSIAAVAVALIVVFQYGTSLNQIFTILLIGLFFDLFNTWITNAALIKWFAEKGGK